MLGKLSREPEGGKGHRFVVLMGCFALLMGALGFATSSSYAGDLSLSLGILLAGVMNVSLGAAELLPRDRTSLAAVLRAAALLSSIATVVLIVAGLWIMLA